MIILVSASKTVCVKRRLPRKQLETMGSLLRTGIISPQSSMYVKYNTYLIIDHLVSYYKYNFDSILMNITGICIQFRQLLSSLMERINSKIRTASCDQSIEFFKILKKLVGLAGMWTY